MEILIQKTSDFLRCSLEMVRTNQWDIYNLTADDVEVLNHLNGYCVMLSQTILQMLLNGIIWESEIVIRSVSEGSIKLLYICGKPDEMKTKIAQYRDELADFAYNKDCDRAAFYSDNADNIPDMQKHMYSGLDKYRVSLVKTKKERKQIEQKWSYLEMLSQINNMEIPGIGPITALGFGYGMSSHFVHADYAAVGMIWERESRSQEEYRLLNNAHAARFIGDLVMMAWIRTWALFHAGHGNKEVFVELTNMMKEVLPQTVQLSKAWEDLYRTQNI